MKTSGSTTFVDVGTPWPRVMDLESQGARRRCFLASVWLDFGISVASLVLSSFNYQYPGGNAVVPAGCRR